jgi:hypothetical protein
MLNWRFSSLASAGGCVRPDSAREEEQQMKTYPKEPRARIHGMRHAIASWFGATLCPKAMQNGKSNLTVHSRHIESTRGIIFFFFEGVLRKTTKPTISLEWQHLNRR